MDENIPKTADFLPLDAGMACFDLVRDFLDRFADDLKVSNYRVIGFSSFRAFSTVEGATYRLILSIAVMTSSR
jgi:hypothetical protein